MIGEMEYVDDDWSALLWALGSTTALCRHSSIEYLRTWRARSARQGLARQRRAHWIVSVISGVAVAVLVLMISMLTLTTLQRASWFAPSQPGVLRLLFAVVIPDALCLVGAVALWRPQRRLVSGILSAGAALGAHSIIYFVA